jgi:hypothetical protein
MYQVTPREKGLCFFGCSGEVTQFTKDGQTVKLCRRHLWDCLKVPTKKPEKKPETK